MFCQLAKYWQNLYIVNEARIKWIIFQLFNSENNHSDSRVNLIIVEAVTIIWMTFYKKVSIL